MSLEARRPTLRTEARPTYRQLLNVFNSALAARNWPEAQQALEDLRRNNLATGDNLAFLEIQLLAQQECWIDIWRRDDFGQLALLRVPALVRGALLTAFHYAVLLQLEATQQWDAALAAFLDARPRLGLLLTGRFDLTQSAVLRVFSYQAASDRDWSALNALRAREQFTPGRNVLRSNRATRAGRDTKRLG